MNNLNDYMNYLSALGREEELLGTTKVCPLCGHTLELIPNSNDYMFYYCNNCNIILNKQLTEYIEQKTRRR